MSDPASYTVGWICALPVEYLAAQEFLDDEHAKPSFVSPNDTNDYTMGRIGEHNVVIAVLPNGEYGTASAANVATNMLNSFHNIRIGLMVGIGGDVPSESHDIRLGDIVVSAPRGDEGHGGVFQYDFGKSIQDMSFQHRSSTNCDICADSSSKLVFRSERTDEDDNPAIHYGLVASGNQLMKDALIRDKLAAEKDFLCFEMEAAGLMNTFPCLIIHGICDYSDSHKNKEWQGYAAMVAAAYAKDLLQRIAPNRIEAEERIGAVIQDEQQRCHQVFKVVNYTEQKNINPKRVEQTCQWAFQSPEYTRWSKSDRDDLLWISADPGCGNSVLARSVVDNYLELETSSPPVRVCYFFFKDNDQQNNLATALCSVLHQLFSQLDPGYLSQYAVPLFQTNGNTLRQEVDELWRIFLAATSAGTLGVTICVFDALDECSEIYQYQLLEKLHSFYQDSSTSLMQKSCLKFLVTSRPYDHIQNQFQAIMATLPHLHLKGEDKDYQIHQEINLVVRIRVK
ncbi:hypothetical protein N7540_003224 [Penicillium herquei]|nr:hypothetical protein N7540_003224 [Penicillium herquei]